MKNDNERADLIPLTNEEFQQVRGVLEQLTPRTPDGKQLAADDVHRVSIDYLIATGLLAINGLERVTHHPLPEAYLVRRSQPEGDIAPGYQNYYLVSLIALRIEQYLLADKGSIAILNDVEKETAEWMKRNGFSS